MSRLGSEFERQMEHIRPPSFDLGDVAGRRRRKARNRRIEAGVVALAVAGLGAVVVLRTVPSNEGQPAVPPRPHVVTAFPSGERPSGVAVADGSVWVGHRTLPEIWRLDPATGRVQARVPTGEQSPSLLVADGGQVWAAAQSSGDSTILRIDPQSNAVTASHPVGEIASAIAAGDGRVWVASATGNAVIVLSASGDRLAEVPVAGGPSAIALDSGGAWVASGLDGRLTRITLPNFRSSVRANVAGRPTGVAPCGGSVWVSTGEGDLARVDVRTGDVRATNRGRFLTAVAADGRVVWAVDGVDGDAVALDCATGKQLGRLEVGREPTGVTAVPNGAWIVDSQGGLVTNVAVSS
jgi:DNA-binding beta-propeller fold protein YncE